MRKINFFVGAVCALIALTIIATLWVDNFTDRSQFEVYLVRGIFNDIGALTENSPVQLSGVIVGKVRRIRFLPDGRINVTAELQLKYPLPVDSVLSVGSELVSGDTFLQIYRGTKHEYIISQAGYAAQNLRLGHEQIPQLETLNFLGMSEINQKMESIGRNFGGVMANLIALTDDSAPASVGIREISRNWKSVETRFSEVADHFEAQQALYQQAVDNFSQLVGRVENFREHIETIFSEEDQKALIADLAEINKNVDDLRPTADIVTAEWMKIVAHDAKIAAWIESLKPAPRSVFSVLVTSRDESIEPTVRMLKEAYFNVVNQSLWGKIKMFVGGVARGRSTVKNFERAAPRIPNRETGAAFDTALANYYRAWLAHAYARKQNCDAE